MSSTTGMRETVETSLLLKHRAKVLFIYLFLSFKRWPLSLVTEYWGFTWCWIPFMKLDIHQGSACDRWLSFFCCLWIRWLNIKFGYLKREKKWKK
jgi:hypothetical protein